MLLLPLRLSQRTYLIICAFIMYLILPSLSSVPYLGLLLTATTVAAPLQNITIPLPNGSSDHGDPGILCTPTQWTDIVIFFLGNYIAHAATTRSFPGEQSQQHFLAVLGSLFFPTSGTVRGILAVLTWAKFAKSDLEMAARAQALCMVVRGPDWTPQAGNTLSNAILRRPLKPPASDESTAVNNDPSVDMIPDKESQGEIHVAIYERPWNSYRSPGHYRKIHGAYNIPPGYRLSFVPREAIFVEPDEQDQSAHPLKETTISCDSSSIKIFIALGQAIFAITTLYRSKGDQITQYGYAAFGLTVVPYAVVSIVNLIGSLVCPQYPAIYLVESSIMQEARERGKEYFFTGTVGKLDEDRIQARPNVKSNNETYQWICEPLQVVEDSLGQLKISGLSRAGQSITALPASDNARTPRSEEHALHTDDALPILSLPDKYEESIYTSNTVVLVPSWNPTKLKKARRRADRYEIRHAYFNEESGFMSITLKYDFENQRKRRTEAYFLSYVVNAIPIAIIGGLSRFHEGQSTYAQRSWTMAWLSVGMLLGPVVAMMYLEGDEEEEKSGGLLASVIGTTVGILVYATPAIGGFVVVSQMLIAYGNCISIS